MPRGRPSGTRARRPPPALTDALALPLGLTVAAGGGVAHAAGVQCSVDCTTQDRGSGFTANAEITNPGTAAIDGWTPTYSYAGNQTLQSGWNGTWSQSGKNVTVKSLDRNKTTAPDATLTTSTGFSYGGIDAAPTGFSVNGTVCGGAHQPPPVPTGPTAGSDRPAGPNVPLVATAAAAANATITKAEFCSGTTLLGTATTSPFSMGRQNVPAGDHTVHAKAYGSLGASAESPMGIHVTSAASVVASPTGLSVQQGGTGIFGVQLSQAPSSDVTVSAVRSGDNTLLSVRSGASPTSTPSNWSTAQNVTIAAASTGPAVFTASPTGFTAGPTGFTAGTVTVNEISAAGA